MLIGTVRVGDWEPDDRNVEKFKPLEAPPFPEKLELEALIPSKDVREQIKRENRVFSDSELATLVKNARISIEEKNHYFRILAERTEDDNLRSKVLKLVQYEDRVQELFFKQTEGTVFALYTYEGQDRPEFYGLFMQAKDAYTYGRQSGDAFVIKKYPIIGAGDNAVAKEEEFDERKLSDGKFYFDGEFIGEMYIDEYGRISYAQTAEMTEEEYALFDDEEDYKDSIEGKYISIPNPFEKGDIIRRIDWKDSRNHDDIGVVRTSQETWRRYEDDFISGRAAERGMTPDYSDMAITVDMVDSSGEVWHAHIKPMDMEKFQPDDYGYRQWDFISTMSNVAKGVWGFEDLFDQYNSLRNW